VLSGTSVVIPLTASKFESGTDLTFNITGITVNTTGIYRVYLNGDCDNKANGQDASLSLYFAGAAYPFLVMAQTKTAAGVDMSSGAQQNLVKLTAGQLVQTYASVATGNNLDVSAEVVIEGPIYT
jgi:hypothetical protein